MLNLAPAIALDMRAIRAVDLLVVNEDEAAYVANRVGSGADARALHTALGVPVLRTMGEQGAEAADNAGFLRIPAHRVEAIDTTAAGDCFVGVLGAALDRGAPSAEAMRRATVAAALSCTRRGTQTSLARAAEIDSVLGESGKVEGKE